MPVSRPTARCCLGWVNFGDGVIGFFRILARGGEAPWTWRRPNYGSRLLKNSMLASSRVIRASDASTDLKPHSVVTLRVRPDASTPPNCLFMYLPVLAP
jgi:hypothetical protein